MPPDDSRDVAALDRRARLVPNTAQLAAARAMLDADPDAAAVLLPIALPGKQPGDPWTITQEIEHPDGVFLAADMRDGYRIARDEAVMAASRHLGARDGTPAFAAIHRDGVAAVFEDIRLDHQPTTP